MTALCANCQCMDHMPSLTVNACRFMLADRGWRKWHARIGIADLPRHQSCGARVPVKTCSVGTNCKLIYIHRCARRARNLRADRPAAWTSTDKAASMDTSFGGATAVVPRPLVVASRMATIPLRDPTDLCGNLIFKPSSEIRLP